MRHLLTQHIMQEQATSLSPYKIRTEHLDSAVFHILLSSTVLGKSHTCIVCVEHILTRLLKEDVHGHQLVIELTTCQAQFLSDLCSRIAWSTA